MTGRRGRWEGKETEGQDGRKGKDRMIKKQRGTRRQRWIERRKKHREEERSVESKAKRGKREKDRKTSVIWKYFFNNNISIYEKMVDDEKRKQKNKREIGQKDE